MTPTRIFVATLLIAASTAASAVDRVFDKTVDADARGTVEISNVSGRINVIGWDRPQVAVHAVLEEGIERVDVTTSNGRTTVKVVLPRMNGSDSDADLEVRVPSASEVQASAVSADLSTSKIVGIQRLKTVSGELSADVGGATFEAKTVSGDVRLRGSGKAADIRATSVSGDIMLDNGGAGDIEATSVSGDVRLAAEAARGVRARSTSGDVTFRGSLVDGAVLEADTVSGDLTLRPRTKNGIQYEASAFSGDIDNCFGKQAEKTSQHGPGTRLMGSTGEGKVRVRAKSMSGDVEICDR